MYKYTVYVYIYIYICTHNISIGSWSWKRKHPAVCFVKIVVTVNTHGQNRTVSSRENYKTYLKSRSDLSGVKKDNNPVREWFRERFVMFVNSS